jgi:3-oxoacyl-[acyl-carrier-protein] synthase II
MVPHALHEQASPVFFPAPMKLRVVVTGMGAVTPLGHTVSSFWEGLIQGRSGIDFVSAFDASGLPSQIAGEVKHFDPASFFAQSKDVRHADRYSQFAVAAAREALAESGLRECGFQASRVGVVIGSSNGGITTVAQQFGVLAGAGARRLSPFFIPMFRNNMAAGLVAREWGFEGPSFSVGAACSTASQCIGEACRLIRSGEADVVLAGGSEAPICELIMGGFCAMRALSTRNAPPHEASRPFDRSRDGFVIAEGAGVLVLEAESHAQRRGAKILAEIAGHGMTTDAHHITSPRPDGSSGIRAMNAALANARCRPEEISCVMAHGTGTEAGDRAEAKCLAAVFHPKRVPVTAVKSMTGHLCGASGATELIAAIKAIECGVIPPTLNLREPDPETDLDYVADRPREARVDSVLCNAFGFGGANSSLVVRRY